MDVEWNRTAVLWVAHDPTSAVVSLYREHYQGQGEPASHAQGYAPGPRPVFLNGDIGTTDFGFVNRISRARQGEMWMESLGAPRFTVKRSQGRDQNASRGVVRVAFVYRCIEASFLRVDRKCLAGI
jgi:hypothetical protein